MWDKSLDEGIFMCDHNSHIITADFLSSLFYVKTQMELRNWLEPNEFLLEKTDLISYIVLTNNIKIFSKLLNYHSNNIQLSNKRNNEIFQTKLLKIDGNWENQLFLYKLFEPGAKYDSKCARCHTYLNIWDDECTKCKHQKEYELDVTIPKFGVIYSHTCEGWSFRFGKRQIKRYCQYNLKTKERSGINCKECNEHFDWLDNRTKLEKRSLKDKYPKLWSLYTTQLQSRNEDEKT